MSITQFFRILFARRWIILTTVGASILGALLVIAIFPPRYEATTRVMLDVIKPDPVTGTVMGNQFVRTYTQTQTELIRDFNVAGRVVDALGWSNDPTLVEKYDPAGDVDAARHRMAQSIIDGTEAEVLAQSNILEIRYTGPSPEAAKVTADAIRRAYIDATIAFKQASAKENAKWFDGEAEKARRQLVLAEEAKSKFEREHGIILQPDKTDVDSARLAALSSQAQVPTTAAPVAAPVSSASAVELARVDAQIAQLRNSMGANNPVLRQLEQQRSALASQVAQEKAAAGAATAAGARAANAASAEARRALETQKARVLGNRENLTRLTQLQDDVDLLRERYNKATSRAAELRLQGNVSDAGITVLGNAVAPEKPSFPNIPLILFASIGFGLFLGLFAALLIEMLNRKVRGARDLQDAVDGVPLLAVVGSTEATSADHEARPRRSRRRIFGSRNDPEEALAA